MSKHCSSTSQLLDITGKIPLGTWEHCSLEPRKILSAFCWQYKCRISHGKQKDQLVAFGLLTFLKALPRACMGTFELKSDLRNFPWRGKETAVLQSCVKLIINMLNNIHCLDSLSSREMWKAYPTMSSQPASIPLCCSGEVMGFCRNPWPAHSSHWVLKT